MSHFLALRGNIPHLFAGGGIIGESAIFSHADLAAAAAANNPSGLDGWGWTSVSETITEGTTGDFLSAIDVTPAYVQPGMATTNPFRHTGNRWGGYADALMASKILGAMPTLLVCQFLFKFVGVTGFNARTIGLAGGFPAAVGVELTVVEDPPASGIIYFAVNGAAGGVTTGVVADENWHHCRFEIRDSGINTIFDDVQVITNQAKGQDAWPGSFFLRNVTAVPQQVQCAWYDVHWEVE